MLARIWDREKFDCHDLRDMSWFIPAYCLVGDYRPFYTKFGELLGPSELVAALLEQSTSRGADVACGGLHQVHALCAARGSLGQLLRGDLAAQLERETDRRLRAIDGSVSEAGEVDLSAFAEGGRESANADEWTVTIAGHLIELTCLGLTPPPLSESKLDALVACTLERCLALNCWLDPQSLVTHRPSFDYAGAAHLVRGLKLYQQRPAPPARGAAR
jgi:hypothetical protein